MKDFKEKDDRDASDKEIVFSKSVKAGKRIYFLDVKRNRRDELFLVITESKKMVSGEGDAVQVSFEKHKVFLYKEDFEKFVSGLAEVIAYINENDRDEPVPASTEELKIDDLNAEIDIEIDFE